MSTEERYCINSVKLIKDKIRMDFTDNGDSGDKCLSEEGSKKLDDLIYATLDYLKGKRAQVALFDAEGNVVEQTKEEPKPKETVKQKSKDKKPTVPVRAEVIDISSLTAETLPN